MKDQKYRWENQMVNIIAFMLVLFFCPFLLEADDNKAIEDYIVAKGKFNDKAYEAAIVSYIEYLKGHPSHEKSSEGRYELGLCYFLMEKPDYDKAARELTKAASRKVRDPVRVNLFLAQALLLQKSPAAEDAERAVGRSLKALGFSESGLLQWKKWDEKGVSKWLEENEKNKAAKNLAAEVFETLLDVSFARKEWESITKKVETFKKLIKGTSQEQKVWYLEGIAFEEMGVKYEKSNNFEEAKKCFGKAVASYIKAKECGGELSGDALFNMGLVQMERLSRGDEKEKQYQDAADNFHIFSVKHGDHPKHADAMFNRAQCYVLKYYTGGVKTDLDNSVKNLDIFIKKYGGHDLAKSARFQLGELHHKNENWSDAIKAFKPLLETGDSRFRRAALFLGDSFSSMAKWTDSTKYYMQFANENIRAKDADLALYNAGFGYTKLKKPENQKAITAFKLLEKNFPKSLWLPGARYELGYIHYRAGRYIEAQSTFSKIPRKHELKPDADYMEAWCSFNIGKPKIAARLFKDFRREMESIKPGHALIALSHLYQGIAEYESRSLDQSAKTLGEFISTYMDHKKLDEAFFNMGLVCMAQAEWKDAIESFEKVPVDSGIRHEALYQAAWSERSAGNVAGAIKYYEELLKKHEDSGFADTVRYELAEAEYETAGEKGSKSSAERLMKLLVKKPAVSDELRYSALHRLGIVHFDLKNFPASAEAFEELLREDNPPKDLVVFSSFQAGEARYQHANQSKGKVKKGELEAALRNYAITVKSPVVNSDDNKLLMNALYRIGSVQGDMEDWGASKKTFQQFIEVYPNHNLIRSAYLGVGWALHNEEDYSRAITSYEKVVKDQVRDETGARAQFLLGECYLDQKQYGKAINEYYKVKELYKVPLYQSNAMFQLGRVYALDNKKKEARQQFTQLIEKYPDTKGASAAKEELKRLN